MRKTSRNSFFHSSKKAQYPSSLVSWAKPKTAKSPLLGRGGSDTTAFLLAQGINANQVVLVTDANGIMSSDPKIIASPKLLPTIDVNTLVGLADSGAKFIHSKALKYKPKDIDVKVISNAHGDLSHGGTIITGGLVSELDAEIAHPTPVAEITVSWKRNVRKPRSHH